jgi:YidC/Oxa1 family membrane protein insertase
MKLLSELMGGLYWAISRILLFWHGLWDKILPGGGRVLGTDWPWILSIVFLVLTIRVVLFPIFVKQIKSQRAMQALQPRMKELQDKYKNDRETMQKELMELYRVEKVNPLMGCLPMFLQIPVFLSLFHVLRWISLTHHRMEYGWSRALFDSAASSRLFNAPIPAKFSSTAADLTRLQADRTTVQIVAGVLVLIMMATTFMTSRQMILKTGWNEDPQQRMIQRLMLYGVPFSLLISGWAFPLGVIIYWVTNNLVSLGQQAWVLHKYPPPAGAKTGKPAAGQPKAGGPAAKSNGRVALGKSPAAGSLPDKAINRKSVTRRSPNGKTPDVAPVKKALGPKPGAKPVNPKKGGQSKRPLG